MATTGQEVQTTALNRRIGWGGLCSAAIDLGLGLFFLTAVAGFFARFHQLLELTSHFRLQYAGLAAVFLLFLLVWRRWYLAAICSGVLVVNLVALTAYPVVASPPSGVGPTHRALLLNLHVHNREHDRVLQLVNDNAPDFIVFAELTPQWLTALEALHEQYPYRLLPTVQETWEEIQVGLYSKRPLLNARRESLAELARPSAIATIDLGTQPLLLISPHPRIPLLAVGYRCRNAELQAIGDLVRSQPAVPAMVLGDLNVTPFSPDFSDFIQHSGLRDSQLDFGLQRSWPVDNYFLRIPIDHCLTSPHVVVQQRRLGPEVGSDHFPLLVDFSIHRPE